MASLQEPQNGYFLKNKFHCYGNCSPKS